MNVMGYTNKNLVPLLQILCMLSRGTNVTIEFYSRAKILMRRIDKPSEVLDVCRESFYLCGTHPKVYELTTVSTDIGCRVVLKCI